MSTKPWVQQSHGFIAHELGLAPRQIEIAAGEGARIKRLRITGDPRMLDTVLDRLTKGSAEGSAKGNA